MPDSNGSFCRLFRQHRQMLFLAMFFIFISGTGLRGIGVCLAASSQSREFFDYKSYRLRLYWNSTESWKENKTEGSCVTTQAFNSGLTANTSIKLVLTKVSRSGTYQWRSEKGKGRRP